MSDLADDLVVGGDDNLLAEFGRQLIEDVFLESSNHDFIIQQVIKFFSVRSARVVRPIVAFFRIAVAFHILKEVVKDVRAEHLQAVEQFHRSG